MNHKFSGAGIAGLVFCFSFGSAFDSAEAACRQILAPNGWQYITVCDGYRGGNNYSGAIAAGVTGAAIAIELLPGVLDSVGGLTDSVGDITSGVVGNLGNTATNAADPLQNFLSSTNRNTSGQNDGTLNPFGIFNPQPEPTTPAAKKKNNQNDETPPLFGFLTPQVSTPTVNTPSTPTVNTPTVNTNAPNTTENSGSLFPNIFGPPSPPTNPNVRTPTTNQPSAVNSPLPNIFSPQAPSANAPRTNTPQANVRPPVVNTPQVNSSQPQ
jgi:hypothetical protein